MKVKIQTFAFLKEKLRQELSLDLQTGATVSNLIEKVIEMHPHLEEILRCSLIAIGESMVNHERVIQNGDIILLMPPASGG